MSLLPFGELPPHAPRRFVPHRLELAAWPALEPLFDRLEARAAECHTAADLEQWLLDWGELTAAIDEEGARRYIAMTCHTDDPDAERAYLHFVERIEPAVKPRQFRLEQLYLRHPLRRQLNADRYAVFDRVTQVHVDLFREENIPLEIEEAKVSQQYQKLSGSLTVHFRGHERTLVEMARYLEEPDRALRQEAWELVTRRRLREAATFDRQFDTLARLRERIAHHAGLASYTDFAFRKLYRFDYTPADCFAFHDAVEREVMPLLHEIQEQRRRRLELPALRPWDLAVDPSGQPPLRPFQTAADLFARSQAIFDELDPQLGEGFRRLGSLRLIDLENRKGKAPGGYQQTLGEARLPFVFMNAVGVHRDVETILHEAGHAFHTLASQEEPLHAYRSAPTEFCEVASMSMELLGAEHLHHFYSEAEARRARRDHLQGVVKVLPWIATVDAFQHWLYSHPGHTEAERDTAWLGLMDRFEGAVDWSGFEIARAKLWHRQLHLFLHPFYYIEYGIAQLGALQVWANFRRAPGEALRAYKRALTLGGSRPLRELFAAAGCRFEFGPEILRPLMRLVRQELAALDGV